MDKTIRLAQLIREDPANYNVDSVGELLVRVGQIITTLTGGIAIIFIIIAGYKYITAFGNEAQATEAKNTLTYAIGGLILIIIAKVIIMEAWFFVTGTRPYGNFLF